MMLQAGILIVGFLFLVKGADWFVEGSASVARRKFGIPQLIIGLTIVAMGTSMPEAVKYYRSDAAERRNYDRKCGWKQYFEYFYYSRTYGINNKCGNTKVYLVL